MTFTEEDIPLMKLIFNPETHAMGLMIGRERAEEIFEYVSEESILNKNASRLYRSILTDSQLCNFFWYNNILNIQLLDGWDICKTLRDSPIADKIWDSGKLDFSKLETFDIHWVLDTSPIAKKIWDSGKLDLSLLDSLEYFKQKFES